MQGVAVQKPQDSRKVLLILSAITVAGLSLALWATRTVNPLRGDSAEYLYFDPSRTVGYPAFLWLIRLVTGQIALAVPAQMILLSGSLLFLGWAFYKFADRPSFSFVFFAILIIQPGMWFASAFLMTEAVSTALVAIWCAQLLAAVKAPSRRKAVYLVALCALATMVRPSFVSLFLGTAIFVLAALPARERNLTLLIAAAGLLTAWAATPIAQFLVHGSARTTSPLARGVLQHTLFCDPQAIPSDPDSAFVERNAWPVRQYIASAPPDMREQFRRSYSTPLRFGLIIPILGRSHHLDVRSEVDPILSRIASQRVKSNPSCYAKSVANEYIRMALFDTDPTSEDARRINQFMQRHPPAEVPQYPVLHGDEQMARRAANDVHGAVSGLNPKRQQLDVVGNIPLLALLPLRLLFGGAALVGLLSLLALPMRKRLPPRFREILAPAAAMGAAFHASIAITAVVEIGFYRYLVPFWPLICTLAGLAAVRLTNTAPDPLTAKAERALVGH